MNSQQRSELWQKVQILKVQKCKDDLLYFLSQVRTLDEHDQTNPIKLLPLNKVYLKELAQLFLTEQLLIIEKSRQMMVTWIMCACHLWDAMFHTGRRIFVQSKKEKDANALVDRIKFIYNHLPEVLQKAHPANKPMSYLKLEFGPQNSIIEGTPQGADVLRQYTASRIFGDEAAFQDKLEDAYTAAKPTITGGGSMILCSSPNFKEFFYRMAKDKL